MTDGPHIDCFIMLLSLFLRLEEEEEGGGKEEGLAPPDGGARMNKEGREEGGREREKEAVRFLSSFVG